MFVSILESTIVTEDKEEKIPSSDIVHKKINGTTYEVVSNYVGKNSLLDIVKSAIKRDIENGNY